MGSVLDLAAMSEAASIQRVLVTVTGPDTAGITSSLTQVIADNHAHLLDIEQVVVQAQLTLCLLIGVDPEPAHGDPVLKDLLFSAKRRGLELTFKVLDTVSLSTPVEPSRPVRYAVTAIGDGLDAKGVHALAETLASQGANIEMIRQLSDGDMHSMELIVSLSRSEGGASALGNALLEATAERDIDVSVQRERLTRRSKRLVVMDMDSTLIQIEVIDELARMHGVLEKVGAITERAMAGELDFEASLRERVSLLEGLDYEEALTLSARLPVTKGARQMLHVLRTLGYKTAVISGGFTFAADALKDELGLDYAYANVLDIAEGKLTGKLAGPIVTPQRKADLLDAIAQQEGIALEQTIAIGDGANDLAMLQRAGLGIAFHAKKKLKEAADSAVSAGGLDRILYLLGLHARDVKEVLDNAPPELVRD